MIYKKICSNTKDEYVINLSVLEHVIDDYITMILEKKIQTVRRNYNLDPESKINSIIAFEKRVNEIISESSMEILKLIAPKTLKSLRQRFSNKSLALLIINRIKQNQMM